MNTLLRDRAICDSCEPLKHAQQFGYLHVLERESTRISQREKTLATNTSVFPFLYHFAVDLQNESRTSPIGPAGYDVGVAAQKNILRRDYAANAAIEKYAKNVESTRT